MLASSVHPTGPSGGYSIAGSMSFENLFMINGVTINENLRGQPTAGNLFVEDAIQETTIATAGISAEYGRFGGEVVNVTTTSGGNIFSGSFRNTLNNDNCGRSFPGVQTIRSPPTPQSTRSVPSTSTRSAGPCPASYRAFNPFTETPAQGVHWDLGPDFGKALNRFAYTAPRTFRVSFGVRFNGVGCHLSRTVEMICSSTVLDK